MRGEWITVQNRAKRKKNWLKKMFLNGSYIIGCQKCLYSLQRNNNKYPLQVVLHWMCFSVFNKFLSNVWLGS